MKNTATQQRIWDSGLEYVLAAAFESGVENIELHMTCSEVTSEPNAIELLADLAKCGATVTKDGDRLTVSVTTPIASELLRRNSLRAMSPRHA